jgi:hypothetical protein
MKKRFVYPILLLIALCAMRIDVHAQDFGTELPPLADTNPCDADPCSCDPACSVAPPPSNIPPLPITPPPPPPDPYVPVVPPPPQPTGPCTTNPCLCSSTGCGVTPAPATCQKYPCQCTPAKCTPYNGTTPNPQLPQATVTVTPTLSSSGPTVEYVTATAPSGSIFSWGSFGVIFAINPQNNTLDGEIYSQVQVFNSNAPGIVAFTIICQLTPNGSNVPSTQSINVQYTLSTNSCIITAN